jgi:hypothetical protein
LRIFHAIEGEHQAWGARWIRREEVFDGEKILLVDQSYYTLMGGSLGKLSQLLARFLANADACLAAEGDKALDAAILALAGHQNVVKTAAASLEGFFDRMQPVENFHSC